MRGVLNKFIAQQEQVSSPLQQSQQQERAPIAAAALHSSSAPSTTASLDRSSWALLQFLGIIRRGNGEAEQQQQLQQRELVRQMRCVADASIATKMLRIVRGALCSAETQWICASYLLVEIEEHILNLFAREVAGGEHEHKGASARARVSSARERMRRAGDAAAQIASAAVLERASVESESLVIFNLIAIATAAETLLLHSPNVASSILSRLTTVALCGVEMLQQGLPSVLHAALMHPICALSKSLTGSSGIFNVEAADVLQKTLDRRGSSVAVQLDAIRWTVELLRHSGGGSAGMRSGSGTLLASRLTALVSTLAALTSDVSAAVRCAASDAICTVLETWDTRAATSDDVLAPRAQFASDAVATQLLRLALSRISDVDPSVASAFAGLLNKTIASAIVHMHAAPVRANAHRAQTLLLRVPPLASGEVSPTTTTDLHFRSECLSQRHWQYDITHFAAPDVGLFHAEHVRRIFELIVTSDASGCSFADRGARRSRLAAQRVRCDRAMGNAGAIDKCSWDQQHDWLLQLFHSCTTRMLEKSTRPELTWQEAQVSTFASSASEVPEVRLSAVYLLGIVRSSPLLLRRWAVWETARAIVENRLRIGSSGSATKTFEMVEAQVAVAASGYIAKSGRIAAYTAATSLVSARLALEFVDAIEKCAFTAYEGSVNYSAVGVNSVRYTQPSRETYLFFAKNKRILDAWLERLRSKLLAAALRCGHNAAAVRLGDQRLGDLAITLRRLKAARDQLLSESSTLDADAVRRREHRQRIEQSALHLSREVETTVMGVCNALVRLRDSDGILGISKWASIVLMEASALRRGESKVASWWTGLLHAMRLQAMGSLESASHAFMLVIDQVQQRRSQARPDVVAFVVDRISECVVSLSGARLERWVKRIDVLRRSAHAVVQEMRLSIRKGVQVTPEENVAAKTASAVLEALRPRCGAGFLRALRNFEEGKYEKAERELDREVTLQQRVLPSSVESIEQAAQLQLLRAMTLQARAQSSAGDDDVFGVAAEAAEDACTLAKAVLRLCESDALDLRPSQHRLVLMACADAVARRKPRLLLTQLPRALQTKVSSAHDIGAFRLLLRTAKHLISVSDDDDMIAESSTIYEQLRWSVVKLARKTKNCELARSMLNDLVVVQMESRGAEAAYELAVLNYAEGDVTGAMSELRRSVTATDSAQTTNGIKASLKLVSIIHEQYDALPLTLETKAKREALQCEVALLLKSSARGGQQGSAMGGGGGATNAESRQRRWHAKAHFALGSYCFERAEALENGTTKEEAAAEAASLKTSAAQSYLAFLCFGNSSDADSATYLGTTRDAHITATLRLVHIIANSATELGHGDFDLDGALSASPTIAWCSVIPQLIARLGHPMPYIRKVFQGLLQRIALSSPHHIVCAAVAGADDVGGATTDAMRQIKTALAAQSPALVQDVELVFAELRRIGDLWEERWLKTLTKISGDLASRKRVLVRLCRRVAASAALPLDEKHRIVRAKYDALMRPALHTLDVLEKATRSKRPETPHERDFIAKNAAPLFIAIEFLRSPRWDDYAVLVASELPAMASTVLTSSWQPLRNLKHKLAAELRSRSHLSLAAISPRLARIQSTLISMPGMGGATVRAVGARVGLLSTKTKPKRLTFVGNDGALYGYLLKGSEDLRQDQRIMQLLQMIDRLLQCSRKNMRARSYAVIPISSRAGLIQWLSGSVPLFDFYRRWLLSQKKAQLAAPLSASASAAEKSKREELRVAALPRPADLFYSKLIPALKQRGIIDLGSRKDWPLEALFQTVKELERDTPPWLLERELWCSSSDAAEWFAKSCSFSRSMGVSSLVGYMIGLGDRHLENILLDVATGELLHIDYGICFDKGLRLRVPETVPFRLTGIMRGAMGVSGVEGRFRIACEETLDVLRRNQEPLLTLLQAFVYDPLVDWSAQREDHRARLEMELAVSLSLFASRVDEMKPLFVKAGETTHGAVTALARRVNAPQEGRSIVTCSRAYDEARDALVDDGQITDAAIFEAALDAAGRTLSALVARAQRPSLGEAVGAVREQLAALNARMEEVLKLIKSLVRVTRPRKGSGWVSTIARRLNKRGRTLEKTIACFVELSAAVECAFVTPHAREPVQPSGRATSRLDSMSSMIVTLYPLHAVAEEEEEEEEEEGEDDDEDEDEDDDDDDDDDEEEEDDDDDEEGEEEEETTFAAVPPHSRRSGDMLDRLLATYRLCQTELVVTAQLAASAQRRGVVGVALDDVDDDGLDEEATRDGVPDLGGDAEEESAAVAATRTTQGALQQTRNAYAVEVLARVRAKLSGEAALGAKSAAPPADDASAPPRALSVAEQVDALICQASSLKRTCTMFHGWCAWV